MIHRTVEVETAVELELVSYRRGICEHSQHCWLETYAMIVREVVLVYDLLCCADQGSIAIEMIEEVRVLFSEALIVSLCDCIGIGAGS